MKLKKFKPLFRGLAATTATLLTLSTVAYSIAKSPLAIGWMDGWFGPKSREIWEEEVVEVPGNDGEGPKIAVSNYTKRYSSETEYYSALRQHAIKQGEEGFALLKNDNSALPLAKNSTVALFGWSAYNIPAGHTGVVGGGYSDRNTGETDRITLYSAFKDMAEINVNDTILAANFTGAMASPKGSIQGANKNTTYTIPEAYEGEGAWNIDKSATTGIVVLGRGGGEGNNYMTDDASNAEDPLAFSDVELKIIDYAKEHCNKVVVLIVSANAMEIGPIAKGGAHEVDAIGFCAIPNAYQWGGIANVLAGKANATGGLTDTYAYDNSYNPAVINMGMQQYTDASSVSIGETPDELGRTNIESLYHPNYIVEAEGIYVGYKYYETRYYDSIANPGFKANATIGSSKKTAWNYSDEVVYTFGHGLSYIPYTQEVTEVSVGLSENGNTTAKVKVTNNGTQDGDFTAQLYVQRPYTEYDRTNKVEKSAIDFLNSKRVSVKAGQSEEVEISVPTKYLASWDSNGAGTYILDEGDYYFTAAAGAHEAVNNILHQQNFETDGTTNGTGVAVTWNLKEFDKTTYATANGYKVENQADDGVDINYWLPGKVTYLTRSDWEGTFPKNYTNRANKSGIQPEAAFTLADSSKSAEWIRNLRNIQYIPKTTDNVTNVEGIVPAKVADGTYESVWDMIMSTATEDPAAFLDIKSDMWQSVAQAINLNVAVGNIVNGGGSTDSWYGIENPSSTQSESVAGYQQNLTVGDKRINLAVASNTLLAASFDPDLAYEWGLLEGEGGLWLMEQGVGNGNAITVWGGGLNQHRHPYNGRNSEYMSEDPMLTNRIGEAQYRGCVEMGSINGPKHMGFNDQEFNRQGNACYMTEQKMRETDIRCYQGALSDAHATGVMMSFARVGAINVTNHVGLIKHIMREEWGFTGIITTDMGMSNYHELLSLIMATVNEYAGFGNNDAYIGEGPTDFRDEAGPTGGRKGPSPYAYVTIGMLKHDETLAEQARQTSLYELYTIAHSASGGVYVRETNTATGPTTVTRRVLKGTIDVAPWEYVFISLIALTAVCTAVSGAAWIASEVLPGKEDN